MSDLPQIGDPVTLRDLRGFHYASRVEGMAEKSISVARPADLRASLEYDVGIELDLVWTEGSGIHVLPTELAGTSVEKRIRLWHLTVAGGGWTEQRRDYVRVPMAGRIVITTTDADGPASSRASIGDDVGDCFGDDVGAIEGRFIDLSEIAAQCFVDLPRDDSRLAVGRAMRCTFTVDREVFEIAAQIVIVRPGSTSRESRIVMLFEPSRTESDALRKQVFKIQVAMRRQRQA